MQATDIGLVARARGLATHLLARHALESLAEARDLAGFARDLSRLSGTRGPTEEPLDVFAIERAVGQTARHHVSTLYRWQQRRCGVLDVFAARQDRRSLRALLRGAATGVPAGARLNGLLPTPTLPGPALIQLAQQPTPTELLRQLAALGHADADRLRAIVRSSHVDLLALDWALVAGFVERATRSAARDRTLREFIAAVVDVGNLQNALLLAAEPRDLPAADLFVHGGRWLSPNAFVAAASAGTQERALRAFGSALAGSPAALMLPAAWRDVAQLDRAFLTLTLARLTRAGRREPLSTASVLRVLLLVEAHGRDLRALAWGAALGTPASLRIQQLVTPA